MKYTRNRTVVLRDGFQRPVVTHSQDSQKVVGQAGMCKPLIDAGRTLIVAILFLTGVSMGTAMYELAGKPQMNADRRRSRPTGFCPS